MECIIITYYDNIITRRRYIGRRMNNNDNNNNNNHQFIITCCCYVVMLFHAVMASNAIIWSLLNDFYYYYYYYTTTVETVILPANPRASAWTWMLMPPSVQPDHRNIMHPTRNQNRQMPNLMATEKYIESPRLRQHFWPALQVKNTAPDVYYSFVNH